MHGLMRNSEPRQRGYTNGLRGPADWVDRDVADIIRSLFISPDWHTTADLDRLWRVNREAVGARGLSRDFLAVADQVFMVYGFPEVEPSARARVISDRATRPRRGPAEVSNSVPGTRQPAAPSACPEGLHGHSRPTACGADGGYGFQKPA
jgi:hypothetical protein